MKYTKDNITGIQFDFAGTHYTIGKLHANGTDVYMTTNNNKSKYNGNIVVILSGLNEGTYMNITLPNTEPQIINNYDLY
jgi:hypothetical protein